MVNSNPRLLILGFRKGLIKVLRRRGIDFSLWSDRAVPQKYCPEQTLIADFPRETVELESKISNWGKFTHVISCVESSVYPASLIRRTLQARLSKDSVVLRCHDKLKMKQYLSNFEIPMADFLSGDSELSSEAVLKRLGIPMVGKNRRLSGGRGMHIVRTLEQVEALRSSEILFEQYLNGTESSVESYIHNGQIQFQNITYYRTPGFTNLLPTHQSVAECSEIQKLNEKILQSLGIQWGMTHLEVYNTSNGPVFGEIALRPPGGYLMDLISFSYGFDAWEAFVAVELGEEFQFNSKNQSWSAALLLHPGEGYFKAIEDHEKVNELESVKKFSLKKNDDKFIPQRKGVGEEVGHVLLSHLSRKQLLEDLIFCERELKFEKLPQT